MNNFPRGSEWRKWDLHIHTKNDSNYSYSSDALISKREQDDNEYPRVFLESIYKISDLGLIAITNHNNGEWIDRILSENNGKYKNSRNETITILPGVEVESSDGIHLLILFNPEPSVNVKTNFRKNNWKDTIAHFLTCIGVTTAASNKTTEEISAVADVWEAVCILAHVNSTKGFFKISSGTSKIRIYKNRTINIFQLTPGSSLSNGDQNIVNGKDPNYCDDNGAPKKVTIIDSTDARRLSDVGVNKLWIKADPTFEGLKQIIYEPEERVRIQERNPQFDYPKPYFSSISIKETEIFNGQKVKFGDGNIQINSNLVAIIGGRGSGKSLLLETIAKVFNMNDSFSNSINIKPEDFITVFTKSDTTSQTYKINEENYLDYLHIRQGFVKDIADPKNPDKLIAKLKNF